MTWNSNWKETFILTWAEILKDRNPCWKEVLMNRYSNWEKESKNRNPSWIAGIKKIEKDSALGSESS